MQELSMFDTMRTTAAYALGFSKDWFVAPTRTALSFTQEAMYHGTGGHISRGKLLDPQFESHNQAYFCTSIIAGRWAMSGFPTVTMGHRTAAALMATKIKPDDAIQFVKIPWPAFAIRVPPGLLFIEEDGILREADFLAATCLDAGQVRPDGASPWTESVNSRWWFKLMASSPIQVARGVHESVFGFFNGISLWGFNVPLEYLARPTGIDGVEDFVRWDTHDSLDIDKRSEQLARQLIIGVCLQLSGDPRERAARERPDGVIIKERKSKQREGDELPQYTEFELRSSIKINLHHAMRDYVREGGRAPSVQTLVPGHWKNVAYGQAHSLRRLQHIHPYWRGDINAPISTRIK